MNAIEYISNKYGTAVGRPICLSKRSSFELSIVPSGMYGGHGAIFAAENLIFQSKNRFLAVFAPENLKDFSKNW